MQTTFGKNVAFLKFIYFLALIIFLLMRIRDCILSELSNFSFYLKGRSLMCFLLWPKLNVGVFLAFVKTGCLKFCIMRTFVSLYIFIPVRVTLNHFSGHWRVLPHLPTQPPSYSLKKVLFLFEFESSLFILVQSVYVLTF